MRAGWVKAGLMSGLPLRWKPASAWVYRTRRRLVEDGFEAVLARKKRMNPPVPPIFDGEAQARLIALACSAPPDGHGRWSIRLLAEKVVELEIVESVHFNTVGRALKKTISSRI